MKRVLALLLAGGMLLSLAACSGDTDAPEDSSGGVTLRVVTSYGGDDGNRSHYEAAVAAYETATGNIVSDASSPSDERWKAQVLTDFEAGTEPDVLFFFTNADAEPFISAGKVVDIDTIRSVYPEYAGNMKDSMLNAASDGRRYAVPASGYWENLFVNKRVLDACGVPMPGPDYTWEQFLSDCETIKQAGFTPIACSLFEVPHYWFEFTVMNNGSLDTQLDIPRLDANGKLVMDRTAQKWIGALNDFKELYDRGFFPDNTLTIQDADTVEMFADGQAAFLIDGSWKVGYFSGDHADQLEDYAVAYVPAKGQRRATEAIGGISMGYFITTKAWNDPEKQAAAVAFVEFMTSDETLSQFVTTEVTALKNGASPTGLNSLAQSAADANANLTGMAGAVQDTLSQECKSSLFGNIQRVVTGVLSPESAIELALAKN